MGKRVAQNTLDRDDIDSASDDNGAYHGDAADLDDAETIAKRKIVTIKRRAPPADSSNGDKKEAGFKIAGGTLPTMGESKKDDGDNKDKKDEKPTGSLFTSDTKPTGSLFGGSSAAPGKDGKLTST